MLMSVVFGVARDVCGLMVLLFFACRCVLLVACCLLLISCSVFLVVCGCLLLFSWLCDVVVVRCVLSVVVVVVVAC